MKTATEDEIQQKWDRAEFAAKAASKEMGDFLARCHAEGPPQSPEERRQLGAEFLEIQDRCVKRVLEIGNRASAGVKAPHLSPVNSASKLTRS